MYSLGLIFGFNFSCMNQCEICAEVKITKKSCVSVNRKTELLSLIHTDLGKLKLEVVKIIMWPLLMIIVKMKKIIHEINSIIHLNLNMEGYNLTWNI